METKTAYLLVDVTLSDLKKNYKSGRTFEANGHAWMLTGSYTKTPIGLYSLEMILVPSDRYNGSDEHTEVNYG